MGALKQTDKVINKGFGSFGRITERKVTKPRVKQLGKRIKRIKRFISKRRQ